MGHYSLGQLVFTRNLAALIVLLPFTGAPGASSNLGGRAAVDGMLI